VKIKVCTSTENS